MDFQSKTKRKVKHHPAGVISLIHPFIILKPLLWLSPNAVWSFLQVVHRSHHWGNERRSCQNVGRYQTVASKNGRPNSWKERETNEDESCHELVSWNIKKGIFESGNLGKMILSAINKSRTWNSLNFTWTFKLPKHFEEHPLMSSQSAMCFFCCHTQISPLRERWEWRDNPSAIAAPVLGATWPRSACIIKPFSNSFPIKVDFKPATGSRSMMPKSLQITRNTHFAWNVSSQINKMWNMRWNKNQEMLQMFSDSND